MQKLEATFGAMGAKLSGKVTRMKERGDYFSQKSGAHVEQIRQLLQSRSDKDKAEGMTRLIAFISKGEDMAHMFPDVVKMVVCKNLHVKKLVYHYLVHYAELEPEASLLSINTFQKDLSNNNQVIRALALRVLSSIRVRVITQIIVLSVRKCSGDPSSYVRKAAAHALTKVHALDSEGQYDSLVELLTSLLADSTNMVVGSAVAAFNEICPEHWDLIHPHFRKLCRMVVDMDKWSQVHVINLLTRYALHHFVDPNPDEGPAGTRQPAKKTAFYSDSEDGSDSDSSSLSMGDVDGTSVQLDADHRMLLNGVAPLLQSRNHSVVLAVASCFYHTAPLHEAQRVGKPLVRLLRTSREHAYIVLTNVATMVSKRPGMFQPYLSDFYVLSTDPSYTKNLKLQILTQLATNANIGKILREFNTYIRGDDKAFVTKAIAAIGRCAAALPDVTDSCMTGLMALMTHRNEQVVAESVVVIKKLLQMAPGEYTDNVQRLARMFDKVTAERARAAIVWCIGEYCEHIAQYAPDVLRKLAKTYKDECVAVKLQTLSLGAKLSLTNPTQTQRIFAYVLDVASFDMNYDVRDRARVMRSVLFNQQGSFSTLHAHARKLFMQAKPTPSLEDPAAASRAFRLGTLAHLLCQSTPGYTPLEAFPAQADEAAREERNKAQVSMAPSVTWSSSSSSSSSSGSYTGSSSSDSESGSGASWFSSSSGSSSSSSDSSSSGDDSAEESSDDDDAAVATGGGGGGGLDALFAGFSSPGPGSAAALGPTGFSGTPVPAPKRGGNTLDDVFGAMSMGGGPPAAGSGGGGASPLITAPGAGGAAVAHGPTTSLLSSASTGGLSVDYHFVRKVSMYGRQSSTVQLQFCNQGQAAVTNVGMEPSGSVKVVPFATISSLAPGASMEAVVNVTFTSATSSAKFRLRTGEGSFSCTLAPQPGELLHATHLSIDDWQAKRTALGGMHEHSFTVNMTQPDADALARAILTACNVTSLSPSGQGELRFCAESMLSQKPVLVAATVSASEAKVHVHCEDSVFGSLLAKALQSVLEDAL